MIRRGARLRDESLAAIVLDARREPAQAKRRARQGHLLAGDGLAAIVLGSRERSTRGRVGTALTVTVLLYVGLGAGVLARAPRTNEARPVSSSPAAGRAHRRAPVASPPRAQSASGRATARARAARAKMAALEPTAPSEVNEPPPPAEAGQVVAAEPAAPTLDFTSFGIASGRGQRYAGGVTASAGSNPRAVSAASGALAGAKKQGSGRSLARPVGAPRNGDWGCPWPREASGLALDEQVVVLRAVVRADGSVASVSLTSDPGFGFGPVAIACARRQQFPPATDAQGQPILATSPPIRFRFTRQ